MCRNMQLPSGDAEMTVTKGNDNLRIDRIHLIIRLHLQDYPLQAGLGFVPVIVDFKNG